MDLRSTALQDGRTYGNVTVSSGAKAHLGDNFFYNHYDGPPPKDVYNGLLASLAFDQMDARLRNVAAALPNTCEWIMSRDEFRIWSECHSVEENHGILWIKGKPGSGKSTVMKEVISWAECACKGEIILSYFFNARATEQLEKTCLGLYRSLLHQLLRSSNSIRPLFIQEFSSKVNNNQVGIWTEVELQNFLITLVSRKHLTCLSIFIDALDEGDEDNVRSMVEFFEQLSLHANPAGVKFRLCLSSRHYPHISLEGALSITLEYQPEHNKAIQVYVDRKLRGKDSQMKEDVKLLLLQKAAGVFLWVVIVVPMLNQIHDRGRGMKSIREKLDTIPQTLHELFVSLLSRDPDTKQECSAMLSLVLHSLRHLNPLELYSLVQYKCDTKVDDTTIDRLPGQDMEEYLNTRGEFVLRWITDCSRGLVEVVGRCTRVQFIHETVRGSLMSMNLDSFHRSSSLPSTNLFFNFEIPVSHCFIAEWCIGYYLDVYDRLSLASNERGSALYAANYWWQHAKQAQITRRLLGLAMKLVCNRAALEAWAQYGGRRRIFGQQKAEDRDINYSIRTFGSPGTEIYPSSDEPMYYAALIGIAELVDWMLLNGQSANAYGRHYGSALQAASARGYKSIVGKLIAAGAEINKDGGRYGNALTAASLSRHVDITRLLLVNGAKLGVLNYRNALENAMVTRDEDMVVLLMSECREMPARLATIDFLLYVVCEMSDLLGYGNSARLFNRAMLNIFRVTDIEVIVVASWPKSFRQRIWPFTQSHNIAKQAELLKASHKIREKPFHYLIVPEALRKYMPTSEHDSDEWYRYRVDTTVGGNRQDFLYGPLLPSTASESYRE